MSWMDSMAVLTKAGVMLLSGLYEVGDGAVHSVSDLGLFLRAIAYCEKHYDTSKSPHLP